MIYRKKPIMVEANQWFPSIQETGKPRKPELHGVRFCPPNRADLSATRGIIIDRPGRYVIDTRTGPIDVEAGDWIVKAHGERYPVKPDVFELTYEPAKSLVKEKSRRLFARIKWFGR